MKGKKGNAAANRHRVEELERRAADGERRALKAETEASQLKAQLERQTTSLRRDLADLRKQRDTAASPAITALEQQLAEIRGERDEAVKKFEAARKRYEGLFTKIRDTFISFGFSNTEAIEITGVAASGEAITLITENSGVSQAAHGRISTEGIHRIQAAHGARKNVDLRAKLIAALSESDGPAS